MKIILIVLVIVVIAVVVLALLSRRGKNPTQAGQQDLPEDQARSVESEPEDLEQLKGLHERGKDTHISADRAGRSGAIAGEEGKSE